jgi:predicted ribosomally synthesized peptide with nif11-like leader
LATPNEKVQAALARLEQDPALLDQLDYAPDLESAQAILDSLGIDVSIGDLLAHQTIQDVAELQEQELELVAGGIRLSICCNSCQCTICSVTIVIGKVAN